MPTAQQILTRAAKAIRYLGRSESLSAQDANDGLDAMNALLQSWSGEGLMSHANVLGSHTLVANTQSYTIGSGGTINTTWPVDIIQAYVRDANNIDYPLEIIPQAKWERIGYKSNTAQIPSVLFYDTQYPLGVIYIFPVPTLAYTLYFTSKILQTNFSTMTHSLSAPPAYERAYILNLAMELQSAGFPSNLSPQDYASLVTNASEAKGNLKRNNIKEVIADYDDAIVSRSAATWNIYTDGFPRR